MRAIVVLKQWYSCVRLSCHDFVLHLRQTPRMKSCYFFLPYLLNHVVESETDRSDTSTRLSTQPPAVPFFLLSLDWATLLSHGCEIRALL
jgi:hypothetical protein